MNGSRQRPYVQIRQLPSEVRSNLARCLDKHAENDWKMLAHRLSFSESAIQTMERDMVGPEPISATIALLKRWQTHRPTAPVNELFVELGRMEKSQGMRMLIPYVNQDLLQLLPESERHHLQNMQGQGQRYDRERQNGCYLPGQYHMVMGGHGPGQSHYSNSSNGQHPYGQRQGPPAPYLPSGVYDDEPGHESSPTQQETRDPRYNPHMTYQGQYLPAQPGRVTSAQPVHSGGGGADAGMGHVQSSQSTGPMHGSCISTPGQRVSDQCEAPAINGHTAPSDDLPATAVAVAGGVSADDRSESARAESHLTDRLTAVRIASDAVPPQSCQKESAGPSHPTSSLADAQLRLSKINKAPIYGHITPTGRLIDRMQPKAPLSVFGVAGSGGSFAPAQVPQQANAGTPTSAYSKQLQAIQQDNQLLPSALSAALHQQTQPQPWPTGTTLPTPPSPPPFMDTSIGFDFPSSPRHPAVDCDTSPATSTPPVTNSSSASVSLGDPPLSLLHYAYATLQRLTKDFAVDDSKLVLGQGGFGTVYKMYSNSAYYAVKKLACSTVGQTVLQGFQSVEEVQRELQTLSVMRSKYLVTLVGYSDDGPEPCLVYEFMVNGSLSSWLFEEAPPKLLRGPLTGTERLSIAVHVARALCFLHNAGDPVIHCNVKSSNILLDRHMDAKLADCGHVRRLSSQASPQSRTMVHTRSQYEQRASAYMDPDVCLRKLSPKVDIYSLGVVMLEMLTGLRAYDENRKQPDLMESDIGERLFGRLNSATARKLFVAICDKTLDADMSPDELVKFGDIVDNCLDDRQRRPEAQEVDTKLTGLQARCSVRQSTDAIALQHS